MWSLALAVSAFAQSSPDSAGTAVDPFQEPDDSDLFRFEEQLVTVASRYAQTVRKAPSIVSVVSADQIRERGYRTVSDLLRDLPGFYIWKTPEGRDIAAIRGVVSADDNKLLVLVDGMPWYEGVYTHGFIDDYLPISNVRQVEVIKGPGSAIYGTNAFLGVVNVVTWSGADLEGGRARWIGGSTGRSDATLSGGGRIGQTGASASVYARVLTQSGDGLDLTPDGQHDVVATDPKEAVDVGATLDFGGLEVQLHHVDYAHTYLFQPREDPLQALGRTLDTFDLQYHDTFSTVRYRWDLGHVTLAPYVSYHRYDDPGAYFYGGAITVDPDTLTATQDFVTVNAEKTTERRGAGLDLEAEPAVDHVLVGGVGVETVRVLSLYDQAFPTDGPPYVANGFAVLDDCGQVAGLPANKRECGVPSLLNVFGYAQYTWTAAPSVELTGGLRVDKRLPRNEGEQPGDGVFVVSASPRLGLLLVPSDRFSTKLLYGRAFRAPNVRELLVRAEPDPDTGIYPFTTGNLDVQPETVHTAEGEIVTQPAEGLELRFDGNGSLLSNEIDKVAPGIYCNLPGDLVVVGGEAGVRTTRGPVTANLDYSLSLARYGQGGAARDDLCVVDYGGRQQYEFPPHMVKGGLRVAATDTLSATVFGELYSARPRRVWSPTAHHEDGAAFGLLHVAARARSLGPGGRFEVGAAVRNVLGTAWNTGVYRDDADVEDVTGAVQGEGRAVLVSVEGKL